jgi:hypothetical protein
MVRTPVPRDGRTMDDHEVAMIAEIRGRMAERGEPADDLTDAQLHRALHIALVTLAHEYALDGERIRRPSASARSGYPPRGPAGAERVGPPSKEPCRLSAARPKRARASSIRSVFRRKAPISGVSALSPLAPGD